MGVAFGVVWAARPRFSVKVAKGSRNATKNVRLNADKQPCLCKEEDLVLLQKPSEEDDGARVGRRGTTRKKNNGDDAAALVESANGTEITLQEALEPADNFDAALDTRPVPHSRWERRKLKS